MADESYVQLHDNTDESLHVRVWPQRPRLNSSLVYEDSASDDGMRKCSTTRVSITFFISPTYLGRISHTPLTMYGMNTENR